jgi:hypothetical protein
MTQTSSPSNNENESILYTWGVKIFVIAICLAALVTAYGLYPTVVGGI